MSQRLSGFTRVPDEQYQTVPWPVHALLCHLPKPRCAWDPCDRGDGLLIDTLLRLKINAIGTEHDFLQIMEPPTDVDMIVCNPPYGENRRGELAVAFIEHTLALKVPCVAMLLRVDFDSAISRQHLFRKEPRFAFKLVLLNRIKWFEGPSSPSDNHAWFVWQQDNEDMPTIRYTRKTRGSWLLNGCKMNASMDLTKQRFGRWIVLTKWLAPCGREVLWRCCCDCGAERLVRGGNLRNGRSLSCGCRRREVTARRSFKHGQSERTRAYMCWQQMKQRCLNPRNKDYSYYGGRGVSVCSRWMMFENFFADMGAPPSNLTLDRINPFGNYEPGNCRWATREEQTANRRITITKNEDREEAMR